MPPWERPNNADTRYSDTRPSKGRNISNAMVWSTEPSSSVLSPPMRSQMSPDVRRLTIPKPSISDSICAPRAAP